MASCGWWPQLVEGWWWDTPPPTTTCHMGELCLFFGHFIWHKTFHLKILTKHLCCSVFFWNEMLKDNIFSFWDVWLECSIRRNLKIIVLIISWFCLFWNAIQLYAYGHFTRFRASYRHTAIVHNNSIVRFVTIVIVQFYPHRQHGKQKLPNVINMLFLLRFDKKQSLVTNVGLDKQSLNIYGSWRPC